MVIFYSSRNAARAASFGKMHDAGPGAPNGQRYGRKLSAISGNSSQRRKLIRAIKAQA